MTATIEYATRRDRQELLDFLLTVFRRNNASHPKFEDIYPDLFLADDEVLGRHAVIRENGRIAACVGTYPLLMQVCGKRILTAGVGQVATAEAAQGKGYMTALLTHELARCREEGAVVAWLGGRRDRYSHFGFDCAGLRFDYVLDARSVRNIKETMSVTHVAATAPGAITEEMFALRETTVDSVIEPLETYRLQMTRLGFKFEIWSAGTAACDAPVAWAVVDANEGANRIEEWCGSFEGRVQIIAALARANGRAHRMEIPQEKELSAFLREHSTYFSPHSAMLAVLDREKLLKDYGDLLPAGFTAPSAADPCALVRALFGPGRDSAELPFAIPGIFHV